MDLDPPPEARIIPNGEPIEGGQSIFEGTIAGARDFIAQLDEAQRADISIWTPGHVFSAAELAATPPGTEHEPQRG